MLGILYAMVPISSLELYSEVYRKNLLLNNSNSIHIVCEHTRERRNKARHSRRSHAIQGSQRQVSVPLGQIPKKSESFVSISAFFVAYAGMLDIALLDILCVFADNAGVAQAACTKPSSNHPTMNEITNDGPISLMSTALARGVTAPIASGNIRDHVENGHRSVLTVRAVW